MDFLDLLQHRRDIISERVDPMEDIDILNDMEENMVLHHPILEKTEP